MIKISAIFAMSKDGVIGDRNTNDLPWKLPNDLKWFKAHTENQIIIMGNNTFKSFGSKPLKNRFHVIITRDKNFVLEQYLHKLAAIDTTPIGEELPFDPNIFYAFSLENAIEIARNHNEVFNTNKEVFIIGGAQIFEEAKNLGVNDMVRKLYVTVVDHEFGEGNYARFSYDSLIWREIEKIENKIDENHKYNYDFITLERAINLIGI